MEPFVQFLLQLTTKMAMVAAVFAALAVLTKRKAIGAALVRCRRESSTNAGLFAINYIVLAPVFVVVAVAVEDSLPRLGGFAAVWEAIPLWLAVVLAIPVIELAAYWRHRLEHDRSLWRFHATHHADQALTWFSVTRKHPVGKLLEMLVDILPLLVLGAPAAIVVAAQFVRGWWGYFIHADLPWTLGPLGRVLISPAAHRLHHVRDESLMGANYGNMLTVWDRLFGTWADPAPHLGCATGIVEGTRGVVGELKRPWEGRYRAHRSDAIGEAQRTAAN